MRMLKGIVAACFIVIVMLIALTQIQLPEVKGSYQVEISGTSVPYTGWAPLDVVAASFCYILKSPTITSDLLVFMYFAGICAVSYIGSILGIFVAIIERGKEADFIFALSFVGCVFFAIFTTVIAVLI